jgi:hypothetical protein
MRTLAGWLGCLIISLILVEPTWAQVLNLTRDAESGVDSFIGWERAWDRNCNTVPVTVIVTKNPEKGTISVVPGVASTIPESTPASGDTSACAGKPATGNAIRYKSNAGFHGTDSVSYNVSNQPQRPRTISIKVK